jgi:hypothetical protein
VVYAPSNPLGWPDTSSSIAKAVIQLEVDHQTMALRSDEAGSLTFPLRI